MPVHLYADDIVFSGSNIDFRRLSSCSSFYAAVILGGETRIVRLPEGDGEIIFFIPAELNLNTLERFVRVYVVAFMVLAHIYESS